MSISIVSTLYHSREYIRPFYERCRKVVEAAGLDYEFIFVNDGSPDDSVEVAAGLTLEDERVAVVDLSRNFGHHKAMMAGLQHATGEQVFLIDVDLEEPPECFEQLWATYRQHEADVAFGVQPVRRGPAMHDVAGRLYYWIFNQLSEIPMENNQLTARVMSRRYVDALLQHREEVFSIEAIWSATGFVQIPVAIEKNEHKGASTYTFSKKMALVINAITAYSSRPLSLVAWFGIIMTLGSFLYIGLVLFQYLFLGWRVSGYTSLIISIWLVGGLVLFNLGIVSTYLAVIFREVKRRPYVLVRQVIRSKPAADAQSHEHRH